MPLMMVFHLFHFWDILLFSLDKISGILKSSGFVLFKPF